MASEQFFDEISEQSKVKVAIVTKYFKAWSKVIVSVIKRKEGKSKGRLAYVDLFAGPGVYDDGTESTPLIILKQAISDPDLRERLVTVFNDKDPSHVESLKREISNLPGLDKLKHEPIVVRSEVGEELTNILASTRMVPTLSFVDPWGYRGLSLGLLDALLKDWGSDCIFFFNYSRINMTISRDEVSEHIVRLLGRERSVMLREKLRPLDPRQRELTVIQELCDAIKERGYEFVRPFAFKGSGGTRTSHHLVFVSKHFRGYDIMKGIMTNESTSHVKGVPDYYYSPDGGQLPLPFSLRWSLSALKTSLQVEFAGRTLTMVHIYEEHSVDKPYTKSNYKEVLKDLEQEGLIRASEHKKGTFADTVRVTFPKMPA